jgi:hypothetical protein
VEAEGAIGPIATLLLPALKPPLAVEIYLPDIVQFWALLRNSGFLIEMLAEGGGDSGGEGGSEGRKGRSGLIGWLGGEGGGDTCLVRGGAG